MAINNYRKVALLLLNGLIALHLFSWFAGTFRAFGHSDPREMFTMMATGAVGLGAVLMIVATTGTVLGGRIFCGWACHMGSWQELSTWIQGKFGIKRQILHSRLNYVLPVFLALGWAVYFKVPQTWQEQGMPTSFYWGLSTRTPLADVSSPASVSLPGVFLALFLFVFVTQLLFGSKGVCRFLCPFAPFFRAADKIAIFRLRAVNESCDICNECNRVCLMGIDVVGELQKYGQVQDSQCIKCMTCVDTCHTDTIGYTWKTPSMLNIPREEPTRPWQQRMAPFAVDILLGGAVVAVFALVPWRVIRTFTGEDGEGFMLVVPLVLFVGLAVFNAWRKRTAPDEPELVQIGGRLPEKVQSRERTRKWNSLGQGYKD